MVTQNGLYTNTLCCSLLLFLGKYWGTLWKSIGTLRELDVNIMGIFWELGEFGGNTLITSKFKNQFWDHLQE